AMADLDGKEREAAILLLTEAGETVLPALLRAMHSDQRDMRLGAIYACQVIGDGRMLPHIIPLLLDDDSWVVWAAVQTVWSLDPDGYMATFHEALQSEKSINLAKTLREYHVWDLALTADFLRDLLTRRLSETHIHLATALYWAAGDVLTWSEMREIAVALADCLSREQMVREVDWFIEYTLGHMGAPAEPGLRHALTVVRNELLRELFEGAIERLESGHYDI
ncbi:MAG: HEAT repeat domain-containing protein, partial [Chloroflexi bacterium]|nr:HEAT repeat domain-containing protein [Chloroflexota bacterium]